MSGGSKSSSSAKTTNTDARAAASDNGILLQTKGSNSSIVFEDVSPEVLQQGFSLAADLFEDVLEGSRDIIKGALNTSNQALSHTQNLAQNLIEENNTPGSDNLRNIIYAIVGGVSLVGITYFWRQAK
jgi:hypothetical protein